jgi:hypothetical protein
MRASRTYITNPAVDTVGIIEKKLNSLELRIVSTIRCASYIFPTVRWVTKILARSYCLCPRICKSFTENINVKIHVGNRGRSYFNPSKELPLRKKIYGRVASEVVFHSLPEKKKVKFLRRSIEPLPEGELKDFFLECLRRQHVSCLEVGPASPSNYVYVPLLSLNQFEVFLI